jgi:nucleotide-binding universal stress UspA family protein
MARVILCPVDGSEHADTGLQRAADLARLTGAVLEICVVNVTQGGGRGPTVLHWSDAEVAALLTRATAAAKAAGATDVRIAALISSAAGPAIVTHAEEIGADQIVMGTGDKRGLKRLVLGSVAAEVAAGAGCSVTVAR